MEKSKLTILPGVSPDLSAVTFQIHDETHTIGNALRWMLMKNPQVEFGGYSVPHPSENVINVRVQMYDRLSALDALVTAVDNLNDLCAMIEKKYNESLRAGHYERLNERS